MRLADGTIIPSFQGVKDTVSFPEHTEMFGNVALRVGEVIELIPPTSQKSISKKFNEYSVEVQHRSDNGRSASVVYPRCYLASIFGGVADRILFTHRARTGDVSSDGLGTGHKVLVLCINGESNNAVIVGGIREGDTHDTDEGHHLFFEFNGIQFTINDNGELKVSMQGPTKVDGTAREDGQVSGSFIQFLNNGNIVIKQGDDALTLDHDSGKWTIEATNTILLGSTGSHEKLVLGSTFRDKQQSMHSQMSLHLQQISTTIGAIGSILTATAAALSFSSTAGGAALTSVTPVMSSLAQAFSLLKSDIDGFEAFSSNYLSNKSKTD